MSCPSRGRRKNALLREIIENPTVNASATSVEFEPQRIVFQEDFDIIALHRIVVAKIRQDFCEEVTLQEKISFYQSIRERNPDEIDYQIEKLKYKLQQFQTQNPTNFQFESEPYIKNYLKNKDAQKRGNDNVEERIAIICNYLDIAREYVNIDYRSLGRNLHIPWNQCNKCGEDISDCVISKENIIVCAVCSSAKKLEFSSESMITEPKTNDASSTIIVALHDFQGKNTPKCDCQSILEKLDGYFQSIGQPPASTIRQQPRLSNGKKPRTDVQMMIDALSQVNYKKFNYVWFFCRELWGWQLQDLSSLEEEILHDDRLLEKGYNLIPYAIRQRKSFIPLQVRLYFHVKRKGVTCESADFKLPSDMNRYNELLKLSCENVADLHYISI